MITMTERMMHNEKHTDYRVQLTQIDKEYVNTPVYTTYGTKLLSYSLVSFQMSCLSWDRHGI